MRGSRPGERRGGRQKGTPNKKTAYVRAVMAAHAAQENISPIDLILAVMREPHVALGQRVKMALKALPHVHAKAKAGRRDDLSKAAPEKGSSAAHVKANSRTAREAVNQELMPLDFLQSVIRDAKTPAALQIKVAQAILPYIRPKRSVRPKRSAIGADQHGFAADRELARKLRNKVAQILQLRRRRNLSPADKKLFVRLSQEIKLMAAALPCPCPSRYSSQNAESDKRRIAWLWRKRRARRKLSSVEDAELAHVNARYMAFVSGPEMQGRAWLAELKEKERKFLVAFGPPLTYREQALLICLSTLYPQNSEIRDPDIAAQFSVLFPMVDVGDDGYSLQYQQAKTPVLAGAGASPASDSAPAEELDAGEWRTVQSLQIAKRLNDA